MSDISTDFESFESIEILLSWQVFSGVKMAGQLGDSLLVFESRLSNLCSEFVGVVISFLFVLTQSLSDWLDLGGHLLICSKKWS